MAVQRFYHASVGSGVPTATPTFSAGWNKSSAATRRKLVGTTDASVQVNETKLATATNNDYCLSYQFIGDAVGAGSTAGTETYKAQFLANIGATRLYYSATRIFMWDPTGLAVRCVLLELSGTGGNALATASTNHIWPPVAPATLAAVSWSSGDLPVIEVGIQVRTTLSAQNTRIYHGGMTGTADLTSGDETETTGRSWSEFSFTFPSNAASTNAPAGNAAGTGAANTPGPSLAPSATNAAGTGAANTPSASLKPNAANAAGTGTANAPTVAVSVSVGNAAGTGAAYGPTVQVSADTAAAAGVAAGTGAATAPSAGVSPNAAAAAAIGAAFGAGVTLGPMVMAAAGTGTAYDATVTTTGGVTPTTGHRARGRSRFPIVLPLPDDDEDALIVALTARRLLR